MKKTKKKPQPTTLENLLMQIVVAARAEGREEGYRAAVEEMRLILVPKK